MKWARATLRSQFSERVAAIGAPLLVALSLNACLERGDVEPVATSASPIVQSSWIAVAPMSMAHAFHAASLLPNHHVLVTGGIGPSTSMSTAELYDLATNTWVPSAGMHHDRMSHTGSALLDGTVLVAGGLGPDAEDPSGRFASAELYDAANDAWTDTGSLLEPRAQHTATLLQDGRLLLVGGFGTSCAQLAPGHFDRWSGRDA